MGKSPFFTTNFGRFFLWITFSKHRGKSKKIQGEKALDILGFPTKER